MNKVSQLLGSFFLFFLLILFFLIPKGCDSILLMFCLTIFYMIYVYSMNLKSAKYVFKTILRIDVLFYTFFYVVYYYPYQMYLLGMNSLGTVFMQNDYVSQSNHSIIASTVGILSFFLAYNRNYTSLRITKKLQTISVDLLQKVLMFVFVVLFIIYLPQLFINITQVYSGSSGDTILDAIYLLISVISIILGCISSYKLYIEKKRDSASTISIIFIFIWLIHILLLGHRSMFITILVSNLAIYFTLYKPVKVKTFILLVVFALIFYQIIEVIRTIDDFSYENFIEAQEYKQERQGGETSFNISTVLARSTFDVIPNKQDYFYGRFLWVSFTSFVPFLTGLLIDDDLYSSGSVLNLYVKGQGAGSDIISQAYMDFGVFGVVGLLFLIGYIAKKILITFYNDPNNIINSVLYCIFLGSIVILPRFDLAYLIKNIMYAYILITVVYFLFNKKRVC